VEMVNMSSAQGQRFAEVAREITEKIRALGPSPLKQAQGRRLEAWGKIIKALPRTSISTSDEPEVSMIVGIVNRWKRFWG